MYCESEKDLALKCLNNAFEEGMEFALNREHKELSVMFPALSEPISDEIKQRTNG